MGVYLHQNNVQKELKNGFIGKYVEPRTPGANTVAYFPFENNQLDAVGNAVISTTGTQQTIGYNFNSSGEMGITNVSSARFINCWVKFGSAKTGANQTPFIGYGEVTYNYSHPDAGYNQSVSYRASSSSWGHSTAIPTTSGVWYNLAYGYDGTNVIAYLNGTKVADITTSAYNSNYWKLGVNIDETLSNLIYETTPRTAEEIADYYNQTKSNYGL